MRKIQLHIILFYIIVLFLSVTAFGAPNGIYVAGGPATIEFQLIDPLGNKTGYDPAVNGKVENIPNTMYTVKQETGIDDIPVNRPYHRLEPQNNSASYFLTIGRYKLKIYGTNIIEQFLFDISIPCYQERTDLTFPATKIAVYPNTTWTYEFDVPIVPPANGQLTLTKISQPTDLIKDINTAASLSYIGNPRFVAEIIEDINEIEKKRAKMLKNASRSSTEVHKKSTETYSVADNYREILQDIAEAYNKPTTKKFVTAEGYNVLKEDLEYIIAH